MSLFNLLVTALFRFRMWITECRDTAQRRAEKSREIERSERSLR